MMTAEDLRGAIPFNLWIWIEKASIVYRYSEQEQHLI